MKKKSALSLEKIIQTTYECLDKNGVENISMRKLAELLGVQAMSLYNHIKNKDELLDLVVEKVLSEIYIPKEGKSWKNEMTKRAESAYRTLIKHWWATSLIVTRINAGTASFTYFNKTLGCLHDAGFTLPQADHAINTMDSYIYGFTLIKYNFPFKEQDYSKVVQEYEHVISRKKYPYMFTLSKMIERKDYDGEHSFQEGFNYTLSGLEKILKGNIHSSRNTK